MLRNCSKISACLQLAFSAHQSFVALPLYSVCAFNDFSSCCTSCCNIRGKSVCMGKGICGHKLRLLYKHGGESQQRNTHAASLGEEESSIYGYLRMSSLEWHIVLLIT